MKRLLLSALFAGRVLNSCSQLQPEGRDKFNPSDYEWGDVTFALSSGIAGEEPGTKSKTQASESAVNSLQILVFNSGGNLVAYGSENSSSLSASVPLGVGGHTVYAIVNVSENLSSCSSPGALTSKVSYLKDNTSAGLQMLGSATNQTFLSGNEVKIDVTRFASRVEIDQITSAFTAAAFKSQQFSVKGIYLINVNGTCPYTMNASALTWYNQLKYVSGDCNHMISDVFASPVVIQNASGAVTPYTTKHYFYCYPNPTTTDTHGGTFSARRTRLVVETMLGSKTYYYPIDIVGTGSKIDPNTSFTVTKLTITGPGVDNPDDKLDNGSVSFSINIKDWATGFNKTVNY